MYLKPHRFLYICLFLSLCLRFERTFAQAKAKETNNQTQSWIGLNATPRFNKHWGMVADLHYRANQIFAGPNFYFVRAGANYWVSPDLSVTLGYAHMWLAPTTAGWHTYSNENRIYQQMQWVSKKGTATIVNRIRNEQRWQQKIAADTLTGTNKFTDRVRYLFSLTVPVFKNPKLPALVLSDELCMQMGKEVVYNTFDQNRVFLGIKQKISKDLQFDMGYMLLDQQKASGYQYDQNHTFRLFFYFTPDFGGQ